MAPFFDFGHIRAAIDTMFGLVTIRCTSATVL